MTGDRGETCRRVGVTASYLYLEHEGFQSAGPRAALKRAFVVRLISDQDEADIWLQMLDDRNLTSHAYDETLAVRIYTRIVHDYAPRLVRMTEKIQTLVWN
jgi:nucleotidyltransferase substrate binding protein (TIGR01987 family)